MVIDTDFGFDNSVNNEMEIGGGGSIILFANGWEFDNLDLSLFDFIRLSGSAGINDNYIGIDAQASLWSPSISYDFTYFDITVGANICSVGNRIGLSEGGFKFSLPTGVIGYDFNIDFH